MIEYRHIKAAISFYWNVKSRKILKYNESSNNLNICTFTNSRSGSNWFSEILNTIPKSAIATEPFYRYKKYKIQTGNPFVFPEQQNGSFLWDQFIPKNKKIDNLYTYTEKLLNREFLNLKLFDIKELPKIKTANNFIFKFCFANRKMEWMCNNFDFKAILLSRHPCAVINSQLNFGMGEHNRKFDYCHNYFDDPFVEENKDFLYSLSTPEEILAAKYARSYYDLHKKIENGRIKNSYSIFYENLLMNPKVEIENLFKFLGSEPNQAAFESLFKKSRTSFRRGDIDTLKQIERWKSELSKEQIDRILRVTQKLGIKYYTDDVMPQL